MLKPIPFDAREHALCHSVTCTYLLVVISTPKSYPFMHPTACIFIQFRLHNKGPSSSWHKVLYNSPTTAQLQSQESAEHMYIPQQSTLLYNYKAVGNDIVKTCISLNLKVKWPLYARGNYLSEVKTPTQDCLLYITSTLITQSPIRLPPLWINP